MLRPLATPLVDGNALENARVSLSPPPKCHPSVLPPQGRYKYDNTQSDLSDFGT